MLSMNALTLWPVFYIFHRFPTGLLGTFSTINSHMVVLKRQAKAAPNQKPHRDRCGFYDYLMSLSKPK